MEFFLLLTIYHKRENERRRKERGIAFQTPLQYLEANVAANFNRRLDISYSARIRSRGESKVAVSRSNVSSECSKFRDIYLILGERQGKSHAAQQLATSETQAEREAHVNSRLPE